MTRIEFQNMAMQIRPVIVRRAAKLLDDNDEAEDVAQDTLLKMWSMRDSLDAYVSAESLAMVISRNRCIDIIRLRRNGKIPVSEADQLISEDNEADRRVIASDYSESVNSILSSLPESQQVIMRMRHFEGMENAEIASLIGSSESSVRTSLSRARKRIKEMFINSRPYDD